jgi:hypothetical protein
MSSATSRGFGGMVTASAARRGVDRAGELVGFPAGRGGAGGGVGGLVGGRAGDPPGHFRLDDLRCGLFDEQPLGGHQRRGHGAEYRRLAGGGRHGDDDEDVDGFGPAGPGFHDGAAPGGGRQHRERDAAGQVGRGLGGLGDPGHLIGQPRRERVGREHWERA